MRIPSALNPAFPRNTIDVLLFAFILVRIVLNDLNDLNDLNKFFRSAVRDHFAEARAELTDGSMVDEIGDVDPAVRVRG